MLPVRSRLTRDEGFRSTLRSGKKVGGRVLVVSILTDSADPGPARVGIVVGKRQVKLAVDRNRVKRRLRHLLSDRLHHFPAGTRIVVRALGPAANLSSVELGSVLDRSFAKAGYSPQGEH